MVWLRMEEGEWIWWSRQTSCWWRFIYNISAEDLNISLFEDSNIALWKVSLRLDEDFRFYCFLAEGDNPPE